jgi:photosystem II stability/assembly factor-like uncharacterized protein
MYFQQLSTLFICLFFCFSCQQEQKNQTAKEIEDKKGEPYEFLELQRAYPDQSMNLKAYFQAMETAQQDRLEKTDLPGFDREWTVRGPGNIGARVNAVAIDPTDENVIYAGFSSGGLFKTINGGNDWFPVFDDQSYLAIGDVTIDPNDNQTIYVGTGDPNISGYPFIGNGVYKSTDGGNTWTHLGLEAQRIVSRILIDPDNSSVVYAATMGLPFERNEDRGLYKSTDGGQNWSKILFISDQAGVIDLVMDPNNSDILYASGWDRVRNNMESVITGTGAKIYKTIDAGENWTMLQGGLPQDTIGRVGLAISATNSNKLYALYVSRTSNVSNIYLTEDGGTSWTPIIPEDNSTGLDNGALGGFGWYFGQIRVNPANDDDIFLLGVELWRRRQANGLWEIANPPWWQYAVHADKHDLIFSDDGVLTLATDGGLYQSYDDANSWVDIENIPTTQFYRVAYNPHVTDWYYGGAQDNGTTGGPNLNANWPRIYGGDGFQAIFHPDIPSVFYVETQNGGINVTDDGGNEWYSARSGIEGSDRQNWDMPYIMSAHNPDVMYTGTYRMYKSEAGVFPEWEPISGDLTDGLVLHPRYHTITTLHESPINAFLLYVGTTDGNVWRSQDGGGNWESINSGLPDRYVTDIVASADIENNVYVSHSGYKDNEFSPRIFRSTDRGTNWEDISGDLPDLAINELYVLPGHQDTVLFVATDGGVYGTIDGGQDWARLGNNMPMVAVYDMDWNEARNELVAGTFARSIMSFPLDSIGVLPEEPMDSTVAVQEVILESTLLVFPSPARDFIQLSGVGLDAQNLEIQILDNTGRLVLRNTLRKEQLIGQKLDVSDLDKGIYYIKLSGERKLQTGKFIKQ